MRQFLAIILAVSVGLSLLDVVYLSLSAACIVAIVVNAYFETKLNTLQMQKKELQDLANDLKNTIRQLESEQGVLKLKVQNLTSPGRK